MKIHLHSKNGTFSVDSYDKNIINCSTKHSTFKTNSNDFKCFAGGDWNFGVSKEDMDLFLSTIGHQKETIQVKQIVVKTKENNLIKRLDNIVTALEIANNDKNDFFNWDTSKEQYKKWYEEKTEELQKEKKRIKKIAYSIYSKTSDFSNFQIVNGIKFIIQQNWDDLSYRFCFDPYGFVSNYHSSISNIFENDSFSTVNGGWIKIIDNNVILYYKSLDYGVYNSDIAIKCATKLFPGKQIYSFAGRDWDKELDSMFQSIPY